MGNGGAERECELRGSVSEREENEGTSGGAYGVEHVKGRECGEGEHVKGASVEVHEWRAYEEEHEKKCQEVAKRKGRVVKRGGGGGGGER
ncbi:hypothetical protein Pmani_032107 [Petrolisthes manimaculis]|uniref:Uncharacterized protein n=1 Tax=Petrolisthes manimaculis TaxID=1843537 RepID=A0AAE1NSD8_9EUCA|nr:hypothetical protein Pmani_032107 [Petrolisthes manimaculis]